MDLFISLIYHPVLLSKCPLYNRAVYQGVLCIRDRVVYQGHGSVSGMGLYIRDRVDLWKKDFSYRLIPLGFALIFWPDKKQAAQPAPVFIFSYVPKKQ